MRVPDFAFSDDSSNICRLFEYRSPSVITGVLWGSMDMEIDHTVTVRQER